MVREHLIKKVNPASIEIFAVWTRGTPNDKKSEALKMARKLQGPNIQNYWDPGRNVAKRYSVQFGWKETLAWDVYLFFQSGSRWTKSENPPVPELWFHQRSNVKAHANKRISPRQMRDLLQNMVESSDQ